MPFAMSSKPICLLSWASRTRASLLTAGAHQSHSIPNIYTPCLCVGYLYLYHIAPCKCVHVRPQMHWVWNRCTTRRRSSSLISWSGPPYSMHSTFPPPRVRLSDVSLNTAVHIFQDPHCSLYTPISTQIRANGSPTQWWKMAASTMPSIGSERAGTHRCRNICKSGRSLTL